MAQTVTRTLADFIRQQMTNRHMSAREFAELVGVGASTINRTLRPDYKFEPSLDFLARLAIATNVDISYLVGLVKPEATKGDLARAGLMQILAQLSDSDVEVIEGYARLLVEKRTREPG